MNASSTSQTEPTSNGDSSATGTGEPQTSSSSTSGTAATPTTGGSDGASDFDDSFILTPDAAGSGETCDVWLQDCADGQKCVPWAAGEQEMFDAAKCSPISGKQQEGEPCLAEGGMYSGLDDCAAGLICWYVNGENEGLCIAMCKGGRDEPVCADGQFCDQSQDDLLILCKDSCDPVARDCPYRMQLCSANAADQFVCIFDENGSLGEYADSCDHEAQCNSGLWCAPAHLVPGCAAEDGCCSEFCDLQLANQCAGAPEQQCLPWYGVPPPGKEHIGGCVKP